MLETIKYLDLSESTLAVRLVLKWAYFLYGHLLFRLIIHSRAG